MPSKRHLLLAIWSCILLSGCVPSMLSRQSTNDFNEQLYIDARLNFSIKHPLNWHRLQIPVSSPQYRADTVRWEIKDLEPETRGSGIMLIRSRPADSMQQLPDLMDSYLSTVPEMKTGNMEQIELASGPALKLLDLDERLGRLTIVTKGQARDYIISFEYPSCRFEELLPIFNDTVKSLTEIVLPDPKQK
ncbi:hypothetical protein [Malonomonas rubra]|uniref:hypothetical protein n=1 Tax=Malonomonas rubra TaxID=57040 RepID=UPI0026E9E1D4|nr:hypothetical protein [Malonomonas rubra]